MSQDHPDPRVRELLEKNAGIHDRSVAAKDGDVRHVLEKQQLAVKQAIQIADPSFRPDDIAHDIEMHKSNMRGYEEVTETIRKAQSYRGDDYVPMQIWP